MRGHHDCTKGWLVGEWTHAQACVDSKAVPATQWSWRPSRWTQKFCNLLEELNQNTPEIKYFVGIRSRSRSCRCTRFESCMIHRTPNACSCAGSRAPCVSSSCVIFTKAALKIASVFLCVCVRKGKASEIEQFSTTYSSMSNTQWPTRLCRSAIFCLIFLVIFCLLRHFFLSFLSGQPCQPSQPSHPSHPCDTC